MRCQADENGLLHVEWPEDAGLRGVLDAGDAALLQTGTRITVTAEPAVYPWDAAAAIGRSTEGLTLLNRQGLLDVFTAASSAMEATAVLAAAVCLDNPAVYA